MPNFEKQAGDIGGIFGAEVIFFAPLVQTSEKSAWEEYAFWNQAWIKKGLTQCGLSETEPGLISPEIYNYTENGPPHKHKAGQVHFADYHLPVWQMARAPTNASVVNLDLFTRSSFEHRANDVVETREAILSDVCDYSYLTEYSVTKNEDDKTVEAHPQSYILQPVFETLESDAPIRGFIGAVFPCE